MQQPGEDLKAEEVWGQNSDLLTGVVFEIHVVRLVIDFLQARNLVGLRALCSLDDIELNFVTLFKALIAFALDGAIVNEHVRPAITAEKTVALCVVEPLYGALILCQWSYSLADYLTQWVPIREVKAFNRGDPVTVTQTEQREFS